MGAGGGSVNVDGSMSNSFRGNDQVSPFMVAINIGEIEAMYKFSIPLLSNH